MVAIQAHPGLQQALALANQLLRAGDAKAADAALAPLLERFADDARMLHLTGLVRMHQQRFEDAAGCSRTPAPPIRVKPLWHSVMAPRSDGWRGMAKRSMPLRTPSRLSPIMPKPIMKLAPRCSSWVNRIKPSRFSANGSRQYRTMPAPSWP